MPNTNLPRVSARLETILASAYAPTATTYNLALGTDINGTALTGYYGLTIDGGTANEQFDVVTISGTTCTVVTRDCDPSNPLASRTRTVPTHGKGASVKITDYPLMGFIRSLLNGDYTFDNILSYTSNPAWTTQSNQLATVKKVEDTASAGAADASTAIKGVTRMSVAPVTTSIPIAVGSNDPRVPTANQTTALSGNNVAIALGAGNTFSTQTGLQVQNETYAVAGGTANAISATYYPSVLSLNDGMTLKFKASFINTAAVTFSPNGVTAAPITKNGTSALVAGDISVGQACTITYIGGNWQLQSPTAKTASYQNGTTTYDLSAASGNQVIAHGLGAIPKFIRITATQQTTGNVARSVGVYNGTTTSDIYDYVDGANAFHSGGFSNNIVDIQLYASGAVTQRATAAFDATNITLAWVKSGGISGTVTLLWEAYV